MASLNFQKAYISNSYTIGGPKESVGPLNSYINETFSNHYFEEKTFEKAEMKMLKKVLDKVKGKDEIDLYIGGDLSNQNAVSSYTIKALEKPLINLYSACATGILSIIIASNLLETKDMKIIASTSSHNCTSEKQFRNPTEYGGDKPVYATYTVTGAASFKMERQGLVKISSGTIGRVIDAQIRDANNLGCAMAIAAYETLKDHLNNCNRKIDDYDFIVTGDLSKYGKRVFIDLCQSNQIILKRYDDAGLMIYDIEKQKVFAGGSGPACVSITVASYIMEKIKQNVFKRVLVIGTGALINPLMNNQKLSIPVIAHAIELEGLN